MYEKYMCKSDSFYVMLQVSNYHLYLKCAIPQVIFTSHTFLLQINYTVSM